MSAHPFGRARAASGLVCCRMCGCSEFDACIDPATGETCSWAEPDLCSFCDRLVKRRSPEAPEQHPQVGRAATALALVLATINAGWLECR